MGVEHSRFRRAKGDEEDWRFHYSRHLQVEDTHQSSNQGGQERDLWQSRYGQGEASEDNRESVPSGGYQEVHLSVASQVVRISKPWRLSHGFNLYLGNISLL